jgi:hypothetical protein
MPQNQRFRTGVLNATLHAAAARHAVGSALIHRIT